MFWFAKSALEAGVPTNENIMWPRLLDEKPKRREEFQNMIQSDDLDMNIVSNNTFSNRQNVWQKT